MDLTKLNDEDLIHFARYVHSKNLSKYDMIYLGDRLDKLGYTLELGCCGKNILRMKQNERQSFISKA